LPLTVTSPVYPSRCRADKVRAVEVPAPHNQQASRGRMPWRAVLKGSSQGGIVVLDVVDVRAHWRAQFIRGVAAAPHSMTSSARARIDGGTVRPSVLAVFRLTTSLRVVGCGTGRSAGFAPFSIPSGVIAGPAKESVRVGAIADQTARDFGSFYAKFYPSINVVVPTAPRRG